MTQPVDTAARGIGRVALAGVLVVALAAGAIAYRSLRSDDRAEHPDPRSDANGDAVLEGDTIAVLTERFGPLVQDYAAPADIARAYEVAREMPEVLDGLYCWCDCSHHHGHRSLLTCFQSEHGAGCWVCVREAVVAAELYEQGRSLEEIRATIDAMVRDGTLRG